MRFANYTCAKFPCCGDFTAWYQTEGDKENVSMLTSLSSFSKRAGADIRSVPSVGCQSTCISVCLSVCLCIPVTCAHTHTQSCGGKDRSTASNVSESIYCQLFMSQVQGAVGLHLWLIVFTGKNSSRSFTWETAALFSNRWYWGIFLSLWPFKKLKFWCLIFCATFMIIIKKSQYHCLRLHNLYTFQILFLIFKDLLCSFQFECI